MPRTVSRKNIHYPRGIPYVAPLDDDGNKEGLIDLGESIDFTTGLTIEEEKIPSGRGGISESFDIIKTVIGVTFSFKLKEWNRENINIAWLGDGFHTISQGSGYEPEKVITVKKLDRWYQTGIWNGTIISVEGLAPYTKDVDYKVREQSNRETLIMPISEGSISEDEALTVAIQYTSWSAINIYPLTDIDRIFYMKFAGNPEYGPIMEPQWWKVALKCSAPLPLIGEGHKEIEFEGEALSDRENHPTMPFGDFPITEDWPT
jgi:hypothetical protein